MPFTETDMLQLAASNAKNAHPLYPALAKMTVAQFIDAIRKLAYDNQGSKLFKFLMKIKPSEEFIEKIPYIAGGWCLQSDECGHFLSIRRMYAVYKTTFKGCIRFTNGNLLITCTMALISSVLAVLPGFNNNNNFITVMQIIVKIAYIDITELNKAKDLFLE